MEPFLATQHTNWVSSLFFLGPGTTTLVFHQEFAEFQSEVTKVYSVQNSVYKIYIIYKESNLVK